MCLPYNIIFTNDSFHNIKGYFRPLPLFFHPFGVPISHPTLSQGFHFIPPLPVVFSPLRGFPLCANTSLWKSRTPKGWQDHRQGCSAAKPLRSRHSHTILNPEGVTELSLSPLRGSPCASRFVTGVPFHSTPACGLFTPSGFPPMRQHIAVEIANPEGVARSQAGVQRSETPAEPTFPHHFEPRRGDRIIPFTPPGFPFHTKHFRRCSWRRG